MVEQTLPFDPEALHKSIRDSIAICRREGMVPTHLRLSDSLATMLRYEGGRVEGLITEVAPLEDEDYVVLAREPFGWQ